MLERTLYPYKKDLLTAPSYPFIGQTPTEIPLQLTERIPTFSLVILVVIGISFILIAFSSFHSRKLFYTIFSVFFRNQQVDKIAQLNYPLLSMPSLLLTFNYFFSTASLIYLTLNPLYNLPSYSLFLFISIPLLLLILPYISLLIVNILTGEGKVTSESVVNIFVFSQVKGLIYSVLLVVWSFNMAWNHTFTYLFIGIELLFLAYRLLRGFQFSTAKGASWYYIILYFCTLEILPYLVFIQFINTKLGNNFNWLFN